jgi:hypothetical protein
MDLDKNVVLDDEGDDEFDGDEGDGGPDDEFGGDEGDESPDSEE